MKNPRNQQQHRLIGLSRVVRELQKINRADTRHRDRGISLIELLVAMIIGLVIIQAMAHIMISEVKTTQSFEEHSNIKDSTIRAASMIQREISQASDLSVPAMDSSSCNLNDPLVIVGPRKMWTIVYGFTAQNPPEGWVGPMTLYRCGPPYDSKGNLDFAGGQSVKTVVLDKLDINSPWDTVINSGDLSNLANALSRGIKIQFNMKPTNGETKPYVFGARSAINPLYAFGDQVANGSTYLTTAPSLCDDATVKQNSSTITNTICYQTISTRQTIYNGISSTDTDKRQHFYISPNPGTYSIVGSPLFEDIVYLPNLKSSYTIKSTSTSTSSSASACTRASCFISSGANEQLSLININYLVFPDAQIGI